MVSKLRLVDHIVQDSEDATITAQHVFSRYGHWLAHLMVISQTVHLYRRSHDHHSLHLTRRRPLQHWLPSQCPCIVCYRHTPKQHLRPQTPLWRLINNDKFECLRPVINSMYCVPATSATVDCIFSHGGIFMRNNRAHMSDRILCNLVFSKCNAHL